MSEKPPKQRFSVVGGTVPPTTGPAVEVPKRNITSHQAEMVGFLSEMLDDISENKLDSFTVIMVFKDGTQAEVSISEENEYTILGRLHVAAGNVQDSIYYGEDDDDD